jgi:hypothetical protein
VTRINRRELLCSAAASVIAMWCALVGDWIQGRAMVITDDVGNVLTDDTGVILTVE